MLDYVTDALKRFHHTRPRKYQDQPHAHLKTIYGAKKQYAPDDDDSPLLSKADKKFVQEVTGTFLYYVRAVDITMFTALGSIATKQANPTERTMQKVKQFLDYAATHQNAIITTHDHANPKICRTLTSRQSMEPRSNMHRMTTIHPSSAKPIRSSSKKSQAPFSTMHVQLISQCSRPSAPSPPSRQTQQNAKCKK